MAVKTHNKIILGKAGNLCLSPETHGCSHPALPLAGTFPSSLKTASGASHSERPGCPSPGSTAEMQQLGGVLSLLLSPPGAPRAPRRGALPSDPAPAAMPGSAELGLCGTSPASNPGSAAANSGQGEVSPRSHSHGAGACYN